MGKREQNAEQLRSVVLAHALDAFERDGYAQTTMEQIAAASGVGVATLYRHFPSKDAILVTPTANSIQQITALLRERPVSEPLGESFGVVLDYAIRATAPRSDLIRRAYDILQQVSGPTGHLLERWAQEEFRLAAEIRRRLGVGADELWVDITASTVMMIFAQTLLRLGGSLDEVTGPAMLRRVTHLLAAPVVVFPRFQEPLRNSEPEQPT